MGAGQLLNILRGTRVHTRLGSSHWLSGRHHVGWGWWAEDGLCLGPCARLCSDSPSPPHQLPALSHNFLLRFRSAAEERTAVIWSSRCARSWPPTAD